jgi:hypothetical protein
MTRQPEKKEDRQKPEKVTGNKTNSKQWEMIKPKYEGITEIRANHEIY